MTFGSVSPFNIRVFSSLQARFPFVCSWCDPCLKSEINGFSMLLAESALGTLRFRPCGEIVFWRGSSWEIVTFWAWLLPLPWWFFKLESATWVALIGLSLLPTEYLMFDDSFNPYNFKLGTKFGFDCWCSYYCSDWAFSIKILRSYTNSLKSSGQDRQNCLAYYWKIRSFPILEQALLSDPMGLQTDSSAASVEVMTRQLVLRLWFWLLWPLWWCNCRVSFWSELFFPLCRLVDLSLVYKYVFLLSLYKTKIPKIAKSANKIKPETHISRSNLENWSMTFYRIYGINESYVCIILKFYNIDEVSWSGILSAIIILLISP